MSSGRRVSRSPTRRSESPMVSNGGSASGMPGKMVSVPATVTCLSNDNGGSAGAGEDTTENGNVRRILVRRNVGDGGAAGSRGTASPRSQSTARGRGIIVVANESKAQQSQQVQSLSRNPSRKKEHSPYRRTPLNDINMNSLPFQPLAIKSVVTNISSKAQHKNKDIAEDDAVVGQFPNPASQAMATLKMKTEFTRNTRAIRKRMLKQEEETLKGKKSKGVGDEQVYKGIHGYTDYKAGFRREQTVASEKAGGSHGPLRASAHIRVSARFDYQPDICKDYKETGYCGYGDACKFMHDRGDYKSGWQMEKEWDEAEKSRKRNLAMGVGDGDDAGAGNDDDDDDEDMLPFACFICRNPFVDPVVTKCKHYFCEHCALKHHSRNKKCYVCNQPTLGIFNTAHEIRRKMAEDRK